eukprot:3946168-Ditylum_brightwellii.AAC.1
MKQKIVNLLKGFSIEITPASLLRTPDVFTQGTTNLLPVGTSVAITSLPGSDFSDTIACAEKLKKWGLKPVPHLVARSVQDYAMLEDQLCQLQEKQVTEIILIAGSDNSVDSMFSSSMDILAT